MVGMVLRVRFGWFLIRNGWVLIVWNRCIVFDSKSHNVVIAERTFRLSRDAEVGCESRGCQTRASLISWRFIKDDGFIYRALIMN